LIQTDDMPSICCEDLRDRRIRASAESQPWRTRIPTGEKVARRGIAERIDGKLTVDANTLCPEIEEAQAAVYFVSSEAIELRSCRDLQTLDHRLRLTSTPRQGTVLTISLPGSSGSDAYQR
jgi:hypothetical protein